MENDGLEGVGGRMEWDEGEGGRLGVVDGGGGSDKTMG